MREPVLVAFNALAQQADPSSWGGYLERGGLLAATVVALWAFFTERIVPGSVYRRRIDEERAISAEWKAMANGVLDRIVEAVEVAKR